MPRDAAMERPPRLEAVLGHTGAALRELRSTASPGALSGVLADCWRAYLDPNERALMLAASVQAAKPDHLEEMSFILARWYYREGVWR